MKQCQWQELSQCVCSEPDSFWTRAGPKWFFQITLGIHNWAVKKTSIFQKNCNNYSNIFSKGKWKTILGKMRASKRRAIPCKAEPAESGDQKAGNTKCLISRNPGIEWQDMSSQRGSSDPVSQSATVSDPVSQWASEPKGWRARGLVYRNWNKLCICQRYAYKISVKMFFQNLENFCSEYLRVFVYENKNTEFECLKFQYSKSFWGVIEDRLVFGIILFFRGSLMKFWVNDFLADSFFIGECQLWCGIIGYVWVGSWISFVNIEAGFLRGKVAG